MVSPPCGGHAWAPVRFQPGFFLLGALLKLHQRIKNFADVLCTHVDLETLACLLLPVYDC